MGAGGDFRIFNSRTEHAIKNVRPQNVTNVGMTSNVNSDIAFTNTDAGNVNSHMFTLTTNIGALRVLGNRDYFSTVAFTNSGVFELGGGEFLATGFTNTATGLVSGMGTIVPNVSNAGTIAPGFSAGALSIENNLTLASTSVLSIEVGGLAQGTQYDLLSEGGSVALNLNGTLSVSLINGFVPDSAALFTVVSSNQNLNGAFLNIGNGSRLLAGGGGSFQVNYGTGSAFAQNAVVLSNYVVPEPGIGGLLAAAGLWVFGNRGRRSRGNP